MKLLPLILMLPIAAFASEAQLSCELERAKAEVSATILAAPAALASVGQDPASGTKSVNIGVTQSFSGKYRASLTREAAEARCDALRSTVALDEHGRWATAEIIRAAALIQVRALDDTVRLAQVNIAELTPQFNANVITINQLNDARSQLIGIEGQRSELLRILSTNTLPPPDTNITALIESAITHEGRAAGLTAKAAAESGWDFNVTAGARQPLGGSSDGSSKSAQPFATIGFRYSFGTGAARDAAAQVALKTQQVLAEQGGGYMQTVLRQRQTIKSLIDVEVQRQGIVVRHLTEFERVQGTLVGIDTVLGNNTRRALELDIKLLKAEKIGIDQRLTGYRELLMKLS